MEYKIYGSTVAVRLDKGDEITESILKLAEKLDISAANVTGIGATDDLTVGVLDLDTRVYEPYTFTGNHEINALVGNLTKKDGKPYLHLHITCTGKGNKVVGGHLIKAVVSVTGEIFINVLNGGISRAFNDAVGINTWDLGSR